jgi:hypothetical protein
MLSPLRSGLALAVLQLGMADPELCDGLPGSRDVRRWGRSRHDNDPGFVPGVDLPELAGNGAWLDGGAARVPDSTLHEPDDDNLAKRGMVRPSLVCYCVSRSKGHAAANPVRRFDGEISFWCKGLLMAAGSGNRSQGNRLP